MTFPLTRPQLEQRRQLLAQAGVSMEGDHGIISHSGVSLKIDYYESYQMLSIEIVSKPWYVPEAVVEGKIKGWFG
jgi:hypothetical protein